MQTLYFLLFACHKITCMRQKKNRSTLWLSVYYISLQTLIQIVSLATNFFLTFEQSLGKLTVAMLSTG